MFRSNTRYIGAVSQQMCVYALLHTTLHLHFCRAFTSTATIFTHFHTPTRIQMQVQKRCFTLSKIALSYLPHVLHI